MFNSMKDKIIYTGIRSSLAKKNERVFGILPKCDNYMTCKIEFDVMLTLRGNCTPEPYF